MSYLFVITRSSEIQYRLLIMCCWKSMYSQVLSTCCSMITTVVHYFSYYAMQTFCQCLTDAEQLYNCLYVVMNVMDVATSREKLMLEVTLLHLVVVSILPSFFPPLPFPLCPNANHKVIAL